jgi:hypothetical protein
VLRRFLVLAFVACSSPPQQQPATRAPPPPSVDILPSWAVDISSRIEQAGEHDPHQDTLDLDTLYAEAKVADGDLHTTTQHVAAAHHGRAVFPPSLKGRERATEKIEAEYHGDASRIFDLCRSTIEYESIGDLYHGLDSIAHELHVIRLKDRFAHPLESGYRDILMNVRMTNGHVCEIQLHLRQILAVKEREHKLYEVTRSLEATAKRENRELTAEEAATIAKLKAEAKRDYDAAFH